MFSMQCSPGLKFDAMFVWLAWCARYQVIREAHGDYDYSTQRWPWYVYFVD